MLRESPVDDLDAVWDTVHEAVLARVDRLPDGPKQLVQVASVLGREVSLRILGEMWEEPSVLDAYLRELTGQEILRENSGSTETAYVFKHTLTQEVVYGSLSS